MNRKFRQHEPVSSVIAYLEAIENARRGFFKPATRRGNDNVIWFRGQHCISWSLTPKLYRPEFLETNKSEIYALEAETRDLFQSRARHLVHGRQPEDKWEWYFLMQHYGAPTRLLDWSENPLIALYFAVKNHKANENAVVWLIDPYWLNKQNSNLKRQSIFGPILPSWREANGYLLDLEAAFSGSNIRVKFPAAIEAPHLDMRLNAQASRFVVFGKDRELQKMFDIKQNHFGLARISISKESAQLIEDELSKLGVHAASVFPDIGGLGEYVHDHWQWKKQR